MLMEESEETKKGLWREAFDFVKAAVRFIVVCAAFIFRMSWKASKWIYEKFDNYLEKKARQK